VLHTGFLRASGRQARARTPGRPAVFCRFAGLQTCGPGTKKTALSAVCKFCDTDFVGRGRTRAEGTRRRARLPRRIDRLWPEKESERRFAVLTGGEPALQVDRPFIDALHARGFLIAIETNGTLELPPGSDWVCVSPKADAPLKLRVGNELEARLSAGGRLALGLRGPPVRAFPASADGWAERPREHRAGDGLLHGASEVAPEPADA